MPWKATMGALVLHSADECFCIDLAPPNTYTTLATQHLTMQLQAESNVFFASLPFPTLSFDGTFQHTQNAVGGC